MQTFLKAYEAAAVPDKELTLWGKHTLSVETVKKWYYEEYHHERLAKRKDRVIGRIKRWVEMQIKELPEWKRKEEQKKAKQRLSTYLKKWKEITPLSFYQECFAEPSTSLFMTEELQKQLAHICGMDAKTAKQEVHRFG